MLLVVRGRWVGWSLMRSYAACRSSPPAPRGLDHIGFTRPFRIKCAPYPLIVKPPYPLYPVRPPCPFNPVCSPCPFNPVCSLRPFNPVCSLRPFNPVCSLRPFNPVCSLNPFGSWEAVSTGDSWYHGGIVNFRQPLSLRNPGYPVGPARFPCFLGPTGLSGLVRSPRLFGLAGVIRCGGFLGFRQTRRQHVFALWPGDRLLGNRGRVESGDQVTPRGVLVALPAVCIIPVRHVTTAVRMRPGFHDILPLPPCRRIKGYVGPIDKELAETRARIEKPHRARARQTEICRIRFVTARCSAARRGQAMRLWRPRMVGTLWWSQPRRAALSRYVPCWPDCRPICLLRYWSCCMCRPAAAGRCRTSWTGRAHCPPRRPWTVSRSEAAGSTWLRRIGTFSS
jgi:hypothetical protein